MCVCVCMYLLTIYHNLRLGILFCSLKVFLFEPIKFYDGNGNKEFLKSIPFVYSYYKINFISNRDYKLRAQQIKEQK